MTILIITVIAGQLITFDTRADCQRYIAEMQQATATCTAVPIRMNDDKLTTTAGGAMGGSTTLTPIGEKTVALYHSIEARARSAGRTEFQTFRKLVRTTTTT
jgi:hypothetical protein